MTRVKNLIASIALVSFVSSSVVQPCFAGVTYASNSRRVEADQNDNDESKGLKFRLSEGSTESTVRERHKPAVSTQLSSGETEAILRRMPPMENETSEPQPFRLGERTPPPSLAGATRVVSFPSTASEVLPDSPGAGPLEIVSHAPEGQVSLAPHLSVTFSQPMVAITSQATAATTVPVKLSPQPPGQWRWLGTKTLVFDPIGRFPMATRYKVTIPAGTQSANGANLAMEKSWSFSTPAPVVKYSYPAKDSTQRRDALMFVEFNQRIDPSAVLQTVKVRAGNRTLKTRLATSDELAKGVSHEAALYLRDVPKDRVVAFRAVNSLTGNVDGALPANSLINVSIGAGTPSAEGPERTTTISEFSFRTYGPLVVTRSSCDEDNRRSSCEHHDQFTIEFSNSIDEDIDESKVKIEPALGDMEVSSYDTNLIIKGIKRGRTTYRVTLDSSIKDQFNQTLEGRRTFSFRVADVSQSFQGPMKNFVVLDPDAPPRLSVFTVNYPKLNVRLYQVTPNDWPQWVTFYDDESNKKVEPPGRLVLSETLAVKNRPDDIIETSIDLQRGLRNGYGSMILIVEAVGGKLPHSANDDESEYRSVCWIQRTDIALDAIVDRTDLIGWATTLKDGKPLAGVDVVLMPDQLTSQTASDGLVRFSLQPKTRTVGNSFLVVRRGDDVALLPDDPSYWTDRGEGWVSRKPDDSLTWYVLDDRQMYQPGEDVHLKGWVRRIEDFVRGDVRNPRDTLTEVSYELKDRRDVAIKTGNLQLNAFGGFDTVFQLPKEMNLGSVSLKLKAGGDISGNTHYHQFQVQQFRRPEFEIKATNETNGNIFVGSAANVSVNAKYYSGGGLPNAPVTWRVTSSPGEFTPPNRSDFSFGVWTRWWTVDYDDSGTFTSETFTSVTDTQGNHRLHINFDSVNPPRPSVVTAAATVTDVNRQGWSSSTTLLVHPSELYVGLKSEKTFVEKGQPLVVQTIATDLDGHLAAGRQIRMSAVLLDWKRQKGEWVQVESYGQDCSIQSSSTPVGCTFQPSRGGEYRITATVHDDRGRQNESQLTLWVAGAEPLPATSFEEEEISLIPNQREYRGGDTAEILVQAPFYPAEGLLTLRRSGILKSERFRMDSPTMTLRVPIEQSWTPNVYAQVDLVGSTKREVPSGVSQRLAVPLRPAYASGGLQLSIPSFDRKLTITTTPDKNALEPGAATSVAVDVKDASGNPVNAGEVVLFVVDESILALTNYKLSDPLSTFYSHRTVGVSDHNFRDSVVLSASGLISGEGGGTGGGAGGSAETVSPMVVSREARVMSGLDMPPPPNAPPMEIGQEEQIRLRTDFNPLATFAASLRTDSNGHAQVKFKLPDNLTRYRLMAVAVGGENLFGVGESAITARMPLMVRPSAPRFLNFGDRFELPIVVQNQTENEMTVDIAVRANSKLQFSTAAAAGRRIAVPANDRVEVRIPAVANKTGTAHFQVAAASGTWSDAADIWLPVLTPGTTESFAAYGEIDNGGIAQPVKMPKDVVTQYGGLLIETSSTQLQQLTDAFLYLQNYPFECSEQLASRILSVAALRDVLSVFKTEGLPSSTAIEATIARDIKRLEGMQNADGGFGFWKKDDRSWPYLSVHVAHALIRAKQNNFVVPEQMLEKSRKYLREIENRFPSHYSNDSKRAITAYALSVRAQMGDRDTQRVRRFINSGNVTYVSLETNAWLLSVIANDKDYVIERNAIKRHFSNSAVETAGAAHFVSSYGDDDHVILNSDRRSDGIILDALIADQPDHPLIPKLVRGLLGHRTKGRWNNTQENVFILIALNRYFNAYEKVTPDFVSRVWLGDDFAGQQEFRGREIDRQRVNVPMTYLAEKMPQTPINLLISKEGPGRLYYRVGMNYAPKDLNAAAADYGFAVERVYEGIDRADDVARDADGTWRIKSGARVRVRLRMVAPSQRTHVALMDPLPAGFEIINPELAVSEKVPEDDKSNTRLQDGWWIWRRVWFDHQNLRDDRAESFASLLPAGVYDYSYVARATTPGFFVVAPAKAEEMYHPETFGRTRSERVRIE